MNKMKKMLRENLYDFGYKIETEEMSREFYLKNRIAKQERKNLVDILKIFREKMIKPKNPSAYCFSFGVIAVGTSVYSEKYFSELEKSFFEKGFNQEDYLMEESGSYEKQEREFETYEDYLKWCDLPEAFDEKLIPIPEEIFNQRKEKNQVPYLTKKKIGDIFDRKGEDLDFIICPEVYCSSKTFNWINSAFFEIIKEANYNIKSEFDCLYGVNYFIHPEGKLIRYKSIESGTHESSFRISFDDSRSLHFYFDSHIMNLKIREERIENFPFCQILRRRNTDDLEAAIKNGEKNNIFENPEYLNFEKI